MPKTLAGIIKRQKEAMEKAAHDEWLAIGNDVKAAHDDVVAKWTHKPKFKVQRHWQGSYDTILLLVTGKHKAIWFYVDLGTKPHPIRAKRVPKLKFQTAYSARTAPVAQANVGTGKSSGAWVQVAEVQHPGNEPRLFSETILDELTPAPVDRVQDALKLGLNKVR